PWPMHCCAWQLTRVSAGGLATPGVTAPVSISTSSRGPNDSWRSMGRWSVAEPMPLLVFSDDWGRHPSSCQHLTRRLLGLFTVTGVTTIGTRTPRFDLDTLKRGLEKLRHWTGPRPARDPLPEHLRVVNPRMWASFRSSLARWVNRQLLVSQLAPLCRAMPQ